MNAEEDRRFFASWSGGKDACLALYLSMRRGLCPAALMTMLDEEGSATAAHRLPREIIGQQAGSLGIPLATFPTTWESYGDAFLEAARGFRSRGIASGVFGDIELEEHREWITERCSAVGVRPLFPLWGMSRSELGAELLEAGFKAMIIAVREGSLDGSYLGRILDAGLFAELSDRGIDEFGEQGEYHTLVVDGPIFSSRLSLDSRRVLREEGHRFLELALAAPP